MSLFRAYQTLTAESWLDSLIFPLTICPQELLEILGQNNIYFIPNHLTTFI